MVQCYRSPVIIHTKLLSACWRIFFYLIRLMDIILKLKSKKKKKELMDLKLIRKTAQRRMRDLYPHPTS